MQYPHVRHSTEAAAKAPRLRGELSPRSPREKLLVAQRNSSEGTRISTRSTAFAAESAVIRESELRNPPTALGIDSELQANERALRTTAIREIVNAPNAVPNYPPRGANRAIAMTNGRATPANGRAGSRTGRVA